MIELVQNVADEYGVDTDDVYTDIDYKASGSFTVENVDPTQAEAVEDAITTSISEQTGVPVNDIEVEYNADTGVVQYSINTDSYNASNDVKENINNKSFADTIEGSLKKIDTNVDVTSPDVNDSIVADINIVVDTKDSKIDMDKVTNKLSSELSDNGFTIKQAEGIS